MSSLGGKVLPQFRQVFSVPPRDSLQWFPGHMHKGLRQMQQKLKAVDIIIEVHDARVPLSGRYEQFRNTVSGLKPHIFVLNKKDLTDLSRARHFEERLKSEGINNVIWTNFKDQQCKGMHSILPTALKLIENSQRYNRTGEQDYAAMVIGVPNVGKSSLINRLRNKHLKKGNATAVGGVAGITRSVLTKIKVSEKPPVYVLDTPGILAPYIRDVISGLKLALVGCLQDHLVGPQVIADYLLFWLNKNQRFDYVEKLGLQAPTDDILQLLTISAVKMGKSKKIKRFDGQLIVRPDFNFAAEHFLRVFRTGELGGVCLDNDIVEGGGVEG
ncbi:mitochondrial GTPase 1-like isoform X1 [Fopius arisanus]|uniref:Mitochondrial GTPase 1 n=2 Tax=Fopius arisanus TaxID=64838 RepID=A0A9R1T9U3_9HYME|nr:PREDICTED: mitochondrial GTPase 1-like isoform X1 [Fopius arisanus]